MSGGEKDIAPALRDLFSKGPVRIGKRVWIGENACILPGVSIGDGAVIGAGSVVTKDIPPNSIAAGNPAKVIRTIDA
jgi:acetyltransferase-like isoleucine patch superfamily enzyme